MVRLANSKSDGGSFDQATIDAVWRKAQAIPGYDPNDYRKDSCNAWIKKSSYGTLGEFGWEIDHEIPVAKGGVDTPYNLQPLHWQNNRGKSDNWPSWKCTLGG